jgi:hypothetical protein
VQMLYRCRERHSNRSHTCMYTLCLCLTDMISNETLRHKPHALSLGYLDDSMTLHGPTEEDSHFIADTASTPAEMQEHVAAYNANMRRLELELVAQGGFWHQAMKPGPRIRPIRDDCYHDCGNVTAMECAATLREIWCVPEPEPWKSATQYFMRPTSATKESETQATAQFLLTRGPFAWIGFFNWQFDDSVVRPRPVEWDTDYGVPEGPCTETAKGSGMFSRSWSKATVTWNCHTATGEIQAK